MVVLTRGRVPLRDSDFRPTVGSTRIPGHQERCLHASPDASAVPPIGSTGPPMTGSGPLPDGTLASARQPEPGDKEHVRRWVVVGAGLVALAYFAAVIH